MRAFDIIRDATGRTPDDLTKELASLGKVGELIAAHVRYAADHFDQAVTTYVGTVARVRMDLVNAEDNLRRGQLDTLFGVLGANGPKVDATHALVGDARTRLVAMCKLAADVLRPFES